MSRNGVFTNILYQIQGSSLVAPTRGAVVVGVPLRVSKKTYHGPILVGDLTIDATEDNKMKLNDAEKMQANGDMKLFIRKAGEEDPAAIQMSTAYYFNTNPTISKTNYNNDGIATITFLSTDFLRQIGKNYGGANLTYTMDAGGEIVTVGGSNATKFMSLLEVGQCFYHGDDDKYYEILSIDVGNSQFTLVEVVTGALAASVDDSIWYDYLGSNMNTPKVRRPVLLYDIIVQKTDISGLYTITSVGDLVDKFGSESLEDPDSNLAFGAFLHLAANGGVNQFRIYAIPVDGTDALSTILAANTSWVAAQESINGVSTAFFIVPLTDNETVLSGFKTWAETQSGTDYKREKQVFISEKVVNGGNGLTYGEDGDEFTISEIAAASDGSKTVVTIGAGEAADIKAGMVFSATYGGITVESDVIAVDTSNDTFTVNKDYGSTFGDLSAEVLSWPQDSLFCDSGYTPQTDADTAVTVPNGYDSQRVVLCGPYYAMMGDTKLFGYHIAVIVAGYVSSKILGYVFTNDALPLITWLPTINYFTINQLEAIKDSGWFMLHQEMEGAPIGIYHQKTTAQAILEKKELSIVIVTVSVAQAIRSTLRPHVAKGVDNSISHEATNSAKNRRYIKKLNNDLATIRYKFVNEIECLADFKVIGVAANVVNRDQVDNKVEIKHYYPVNRINNYIYIV